MLYKRPDSKFWWFQIRFKRKLYQRSTKVTNKQVAGQIEAKFRTDLATGSFGFKLARNAPLLSQFIENDFLPKVRNSKAGKPNTLHYYEHHAGVLKDSSLGSIPLDIIDESLIDAYTAGRRSTTSKRGKPFSIATINRELQVLRRILSRAKAWGKLMVDKFADDPIQMLPGERRRERVISPAEERKYLKACEPLLRDVAVLLFDLALRPEELHRLTPENFQDDFAVVYYGKGRGSERRIPMSARVKKIVARLCKDASPWLFPAPTKSGHINHDSLKKPHRRAIKAAGLSFFVPYSIRHTCITRWSKKVDAYTLHKLAGHTDWKTTARYVHTDDETAKAILR